MIRIAFYCALAGFTAVMIGNYVIDQPKVTLAGMGLCMLAIGIWAINIRDAWKGNGQ